MNKMTNAGIQAQLAKGWKPNQYLSNLSMAFFQKDEDFVAPAFFPIVPVELSSSFYYIFSKADLSRDNVQPKPKYGKVAPALIGQSDQTYKCEVDQVIVGLDQIESLNYQRAKAPGVADPRRAKVKFITEQIKLHQDIIFAQKFFQTGVWTNQLAGVTATPGAGEFLKFTDDNFDVIGFFDDLKRDIRQKGRRTPNKLGLGINTFKALKNHPDIVERVKYTGTTANPARVTENVLAQLLGIDKVKVFESTYNAGGIGEENMQFTCDPNAALLLYATDTPAIDEPSAGYIFTWDMLGNGNYMAIDQWEGENGTHTEFVEGLSSYDMKKTSDDLAIYLGSCV